MIALFSDFVDEHLVQYVHPIVNTKTYEVEFFEILSRVKYKDKLYQPAQFLNNVTPNQKYLMAEAIVERIKEYQKKYPAYSFSINISAIEIEEGLFSIFEKLSRDKEINPHKCIIEILETTIISPLVLSQMENLKKNYGYRFALDDFGAGHSNFKQIYTSNGLFEYVKMDGSLVANILTNEIQKLTLSIMVLAVQANHKKVIIEYISDHHILKAIEETNTNFVQGFVFGEPAPIENYMSRITNGILIPCCLENMPGEKK